MEVHICIYFKAPRIFLGRYRTNVCERLSSKVYALEFCNPEIISRQLLGEIRVYIFKAKE